MRVSFSVNRGFGFITFADPASVDKVLAQGNHELDGKKVSIRNLTRNQELLATKRFCYKFVNV